MYRMVNRYDLPWAPEAAGDILLPGAAAGTKLTWYPASDCIVYGWGVSFTVAVTANGFNTVLPVLSMGYIASGVAEAEQTAANLTVPLAGKAIGTEATGFFARPVRCKKTVDAFTFNVKTQGTGGTTTGECRPFIWVEWFPALTGS